MLLEQRRRAHGAAKQTPALDIDIDRAPRSLDETSADFEGISEAIGAIRSVAGRPSFHDVAFCSFSFRQVIDSFLSYAFPLVERSAWTIPMSRAIRFYMALTL
jgi:hypothetical protein